MAVIDDVVLHVVRVNQFKAVVALHGFHVALYLMTQLILPFYYLIAKCALVLFLLAVIM